MVEVFVAEDEPVRSRLEYWRHVAGDAFVPFDVRISQPDFRSEIRTAPIGAVRVTEVVAPETELLRTRKLIGGGEPELCKIDVLTQGRMIFAQDGRQAEIGRRGDMMFVDLSRPGQWAYPEPKHRSVSVIFPRCLLPLRPEQAAQLTAVPLSGRHGVGTLISSLILGLARHLDDLDTADGTRLSTAVLDLLAVSMAAQLDLGQAVPTETRRRALLVRVYAHIEQQLNDPALSPATIAAAAHISTRYLHRLFEAEGHTVTGWIRHRRLERCRRDLLDPRLSAHPVSAIAARWGLLNPAQFSRAFHTAYGLPPSEYRRVTAKG